MNYRELITGSRSMAKKKNGKSKTSSIPKNRSNYKKTQTEIKDDYEALLEQASDAIFVSNKRGEYTDVNKRACEMLGYTKKELLKLKMIDLIPPEDHDLDPIKFDLIRTKKPTLTERRFVHKNGNIIDVEVSGVMLDDGRMQGIVRDITKRKKVEAALISGGEQFRITFENAPIGVCLTDADGYYLKVNKAYCEMLGYSEKELLSIDFPSLSHPEELQQNIDLKNIALAGEINSFEMEKRYKTKKGEIIWVLLKSSLVRNENKEPLYFIAHIQDITERKKAEDTVKESEQRFRALMEEASDAVFITKDGKLLDANANALKLLGYSKKELQTLDLKTLFHPEDAKKIQTDYAPVNSNEGYAVVESRITHKNGSHIWAEISVKKLKDGRIQAIARDITERKQAEDALKTSEERYRTLAEAAHDTIFIIDKNDTVQYVNSFGAKRLGRNPDEIIGQKRSVVFPPAIAEKQGQNLRIVFETGKPMYVEGKMLDNNNWINIDTSLAPVKNDDGNVVAVLGISRDVTEVKQGEHLSEVLNKINASINSTLDFDSIMQKVVEESRKAINCDTAIINLREDDHWVIGYVNGLITQFSSDTVGMRFSNQELKSSEIAVKTREVIVIQDAPNDASLNMKTVDKYKIRSLMVAPLFAKEEAIGTLYFIYHTDSIDFKPAEIDFAKKLSTSVSLAIQNARLYQAALESEAKKVPDKN